MEPERGRLGPLGVQMNERELAILGGRFTTSLAIFVITIRTCNENYIESSGKGPNFPPRELDEITISGQGELNKYKGRNNVHVTAFSTFLLFQLKNGERQDL